MKMRAALPVIAALVLSTGMSAQAPARTQLEARLQRCRPQGLDQDAFCGTFATRESRSDTGSRRIALNVVVLPASSDTALPDPLVFLAGGGVVPATRYAGFLARAFPALRRTRDIVLVDQRGTWGSHPLACPPGGGPPGSPAALAALRACRDSLARRADLTKYSTIDAIDDLADVMTWLGYRQANLYGVSYGTKVAQAFVRKHSDRVRSVVLYGVVPLSRPTQLDLARFAQATLDTVFRLCGRHIECNAAFPRVATEFDSVLSRLWRQPVQLVTPPDAPMAPPLTDRIVRNVIQDALGNSRTLRTVPLMIHRAFTGDYDMFARALLGDGPPPPPPAPRGLFFSILCSEAIPQIRSEDIAEATRGTFFGDEPVRSQIATCEGWPRTSLPAEFWEPVRSDVPVLAISGDLDPITPPSYAAAALERWTNARHVVAAGRSHGDVDSCITSMMQSFLLAGNARGVDVSCAAVSPLTFLTR